MKNTVKHVLSDGVVLEESTRSSNRTGYTGACLSPSWTLDADKPFIAACGNPSDPKVMAVVNAQHRTSLHLGSYSDAREAAYVIGKYRQDPIGTIQSVQSQGNWDKFPSDLYNLPQGLGYAEAIEILKTKRASKKRTVKVTIVAKDSSVTAAGNLYSFFKRDQIVPIAKSMGGAEKFQAYLVGKTVADFAKDHSLVI